VVVKVSKPGQDLRFDVPGHRHDDDRGHARRSERACSRSRLAARLMIDRDEVVRAADAAGIAIVAVE
jgi:DUF1009 family protein